jgi:flagellar hook-associated protein FlgK
MADILSISSSAVGVYQRVLGVVSNNIANVGNADYVRQEASVSQTPPTFDGRNYLGTGALFDGVRRQYNSFIENSLRNSVSSLSGQQALVSYASRVVDVLGSGEIGMAPAFDRFFSAAKSLSADPASNVARTALLRETDGVVARFVDLSNQLSQVEVETREAMKSSLGEVNALSTQLAKINLELSRNRSMDQQPAALVDERDSLLRKLGELLDIQVVEAPNGVITVSIGGAGSSGAVVQGSTARQLEANFDPQAPERVGVLLDPWGKEPVSIAGIAGGSFGGLASMRSLILEPAMSNLDMLAKTFMTEVNRVQGSGVDARGQLGQALLGIENQFSFERIGDSQPLTIEARVSDLTRFDGKDVRVTFDAQAGQVYSAALLGPFAEGDRFEVTLNGVSRVFGIGPDTSLDGVATQLRQFIDGSFGVQLRSSIDPNGQVIVNSSVMKSFAFDIRLSSENARVQMGQSQGLWIGEDREGRRVTGADSLDIDGVSVNLKGNPQDGDQVIIHAATRPAAGLKSLISDPLRIAAAAAFRVVRDTENVGSARAVVVDQIDETELSWPAPVLGSKLGIANNSVPSEAIEWVAQRVVPFASVAPGQKDVVIYLDPGSSTANLQVLTRDGRHLLGTAQADGASFVENITSLPAPFNSGSSYSAEYLNRAGDQAYLDLSMFYGARAVPTIVEVMGSDHVPVSRTTRDARLVAELEIPTGNFTLPSSGLTLNGVPLPEISASILGPQDMADLLQASIDAAYGAGDDEDRSALDGIRVTVVDGVLEVSRDAGAGLDGREGEILLGFGDVGSPALLRSMGFRTAAYLDGVMPEDLLVFTTGQGDVKLSASFGGSLMDTGQRRDSMRQRPLDVEFTSATAYRIIDLNSQTVVAQRSYEPPEEIEYRGLKISFSSEPRAGDRFTLDGNQDGIGDNANAVRLAALERAKIAGPASSMSLGEFYLGVVDRISNVTQQAQVSTKALEVMKQQAVEARESVSGVSLDEEAANLIRFQQAYQAAAKSMQVASSIFDALIRI